MSDDTTPPDDAAAPYGLREWVADTLDPSRPVSHESDLEIALLFAAVVRCVPAEDHDVVWALLTLIDEWHTAHALRAGDLPAEAAQEAARSRTYSTDLPRRAALQEFLDGWKAGWQYVEQHTGRRARRQFESLDAIDSDVDDPPPS